MARIPKASRSKSVRKDARPQWTLKGVSPETRTAATKAAKSAGMTLGGWIDQVLREAATRELAGDPKGPPPVDIEALVAGFDQRFAELAEKVTARDELLARVGERLDKLPEPDRRSLLDRILGRESGEK